MDVRSDTDLNNGLGDAQMNEENKAPSPFGFDGGSNYSNYVELEPEE